MPSAKKKPGRPKKKGNKSATFRLPEELLEQIAAEADLQDRNQTAIVRRALEAYLKEKAEKDRD